MIAKTGLMLLILLGAAVVPAFGVWFAFKARKGWRDSIRNDDDGEPAWAILGSLGFIACLIALVKLAYTLAASLNSN